MLSLSLFVLAIFVVLLIVGGIGYLAYIVVMAYIEVKASPREEMFLCHKHGPIRKDGVINFFDTDHCGLCFHQTLQDAERGQSK